jgi:general secretion pathway protein C
MSSRWTGFFIWALVAASAAFWGIKVFAATRPVPIGAQAPQAVAANGPMERLFGAVVAPTVAAEPVHPESERFQLVGVIAAPNGAPGAGFAILSLDQQPAHTWRVGTIVDGNTALLSVSKRGAEFGPRGGPAAFTLQLPEPAAAETGTLTPAVSQPDPSQMQQSPQVENGQHVAQPPVPGTSGRGGFQNGGARSAVPQPPMGRGGFQNPQAGVVPPQNPNEGNAQQQ